MLLINMNMPFYRSSPTIMTGMDRENSERGVLGET